VKGRLTREAKGVGFKKKMEVCRSLEKNRRKEKERKRKREKEGKREM